MSANLEKLKEIYTTGVDEETKQDNLEQIREWEQTLTESEAYDSWKEHDITKRVAARAKNTYTELAVTLATRRDLTDAERMSIYAKQDAMQWLLSLSERDAKATIAQIEADIRRALMAAT